MTKEDFRLLIVMKKEYEFKYNDKNYLITYEKTHDGKNIICFGERYFQNKFDSWGNFINEAKVENHFLREMIDVLDSYKI